MTREPTTILSLSDLAREDAALLRKLGEIAHARGVGAYVVGGVVRDILLGSDAGDLDIVVEERAQDFVEAATREIGGTYKLYARFGTALLLPGGGVKVDVATARSETYAAPGALPDVEPGTITEDLVRRDFTLNAMAASILPGDFGHLIDEHHGREDLRGGVLRVLHEGSFTDDPTRVLRAVRFQARFGFSIEPATETLLHEAARSGALDTVSGERIMNELTLMVAETDPRPALLQLLAWNLTAAICPCWTPDVPSVERLLAGLGPRADGQRMTPLLALFALVGPACRESVMDRLRAGRLLREAVTDLERYESHTARALASENDLKRSEVHDLLRGHTLEVLELATAEDPAGRAAERVSLYTGELSDVRTLLSGADLIALGFTEGLEVGRMLDDLRRARLDGLATTRDDEMRMSRDRLSAREGNEGGT